MRNASSLGGPAAAGVLIATLGFEATYGLDALSFLVSLAALWRMRTPPPAPDAEPAAVWVPELRPVAARVAHL